MKFKYGYIRWDGQVTWVTERIEFGFKMYKAVIVFKC